jgi:shikimate kinase
VSSCHPCYRWKRIMRISLIGMSGSGKSHWSARLAEDGFKRFCCDDLIAEKLAPELLRPDGALMDLGEWMGFPHDSGYQERECRYLNCEKEVLTGVLGYLEASQDTLDLNIVVDTTGSVIYTGEEIIDRLRRNTTMVYLSVLPEMRERMLKAYAAKPRPVLWRDIFSKKENETNEQALARSYPMLLSQRERLYERHSDCRVDYYSRTEKNLEVQDFLDLINLKEA